MTRRLVFGDVYADGSMFGARVSAPGFDAVSEPYGSKNIPFDTRYSNIGSVVASGLVQCGGAAVPFPAMTFVPLALIYPWDGTYLTHNNSKLFNNGFVIHTWFPAVAIITNSQISVRSFDLPWYSAKNEYYNPDGTYFAFSVFAAGG